MHNIFVISKTWHAVLNHWRTGLCTPNQFSLSLMGSCVSAGAKAMAREGGNLKGGGRRKED